MRRKTFCVIALGALLSCAPALPPRRIASEAPPRERSGILVPAGPVCVGWSEAAVEICRAWCATGDVRSIVDPDTLDLIPCVEEQRA
jgi:hypothetical protein